MKSFSKRNPIPIAIIGIILMVLGTLAALNSDDLPIVSGGTTYRAHFSEAAGLQVDNEVRIAGVKAGKVTDIDLDEDRVLVSFKVSDAWIGDETEASIKIKTVLGRKYVDLDPLGDHPLDPNDTIPLEQTAAPYDVMDAFRGLSETVDDIDTDQLAQSFDTLSETLNDTPDDVRGALDGLSDLSDTIASRDEELADLLANTREVSEVLADRDSELTNLLEDGDKLLAELSVRQDAITTMLSGSKELAVELQGLIDDNEEQLDPVLSELDQLTDMLQRNQDSMEEGIKRFAPFIRLFNNTLGNGRWFDTYLCGVLLPSVGPLNEEGCNPQ